MTSRPVRSRRRTLMGEHRIATRHCAPMFFVGATVRAPRVTSFAARAALKAQSHTAPRFCSRCRSWSSPFPAESVSNVPGFLSPQRHCVAATRLFQEADADDRLRCRHRGERAFAAQILEHGRRRRDLCDSPPGAAHVRPLHARDRRDRLRARYTLSDLRPKLLRRLRPPSQEMSALSGSGSGTDFSWR